LTIREIGAEESPQTFSVNVTDGASKVPLAVERMAERSAPKKQDLGEDRGVAHHQQGEDVLRVGADVLLHQRRIDEGRRVGEEHGDEGEEEIGHAAQHRRQRRHPLVPRRGDPLEDVLLRMEPSIMVTAAPRNHRTSRGVAAGRNRSFPERLRVRDTSRAARRATEEPGEVEQSDDDEQHLAKSVQARRTSPEHGVGDHHGGADDDPRPVETTPPDTRFSTIPSATSWPPPIQVRDHDDQRGQHLHARPVPPRKKSPMVRRSIR